MLADGKSHGGVDRSRAEPFAPLYITCSLSVRIACLYCGVASMACCMSLFSLIPILYIASTIHIGRL
jgi:hypothetical protein